MQNKYLKTIFNLPWYSSTQSVHELAEIDLISELVVSLSQIFENDCHFSENLLINSLYESLLADKRLIFFLLYR
jgi:hypothetical protein